MEFPRVVYFGVQTPGVWVCKLVDGPEACDRALSEGWTLVPRLTDDAPEPAAVVPEPDPPKRRPGRPRKAQS